MQSDESKKGSFVWRNFFQILWGGVRPNSLGKSATISPVLPAPNDLMSMEHSVE
jgi:hypothetical protein